MRHEPLLLVPVRRGDDGLFFGESRAAILSRIAFASTMCYASRPIFEAYVAALTCRFRRVRPTIRDRRHVRVREPFAWSFADQYFGERVRQGGDDGSKRPELVLLPRDRQRDE